MRLSRLVRPACLAALFFCPLLRAQQDAIAVYQSADYQSAIPLLRSAVAAAPADPILQAALLSALVYEGQVAPAAELAESSETAFPNSSELTAARGEWAFYLGDMPRAERLFKAALRLKEANGRAYFGLSRLYRAASFYRTARLFSLKAHELAPEDALITQVWLRYAPEAKRRELLGPFAAAHPWLYSHYQQEIESESVLRSAVEDRKIFELEGGPRESVQRLATLMRDPQHARGVGLEFRINNGRPLKLLLDTGASGIVLRETAVDKAELAHFGSGRSWGVGDKGVRGTFASLADTCQIGNLQFRNCVITALEGKARVAGDEDGLIGPDVFSSYLVSIDFQKRQMRLTPLPPRDPNPQGYDRQVPPEEKDFTPVFRFGNHLYVSTTVNGKSTGLFLLDTGAETSNIDSTFALQSTKIHGNDWVRVRGVSGEVKNVFEADKAEIQFSHFRQRNLGLIAFDLNNTPEHQEVRLSGILGISVLALFHLTLDYRNGLVNMDYVLK